MHRLRLALLLLAQALAHANEKHGHSGEREVDGDGKSPCLWCGQKVLVVYPSKPNSANLSDLRKHEALHEKGTPPRGFVCPHPDCDEAFGKDVDGAWKHALEEHGIARDKKLCLWERCAMGGVGRFNKPSYYTAHEPVRACAPLNPVAHSAPN